MDDDDEIEMEDGTVMESDDERNGEDDDVEEPSENPDDGDDDQDEEEEEDEDEEADDDDDDGDAEEEEDEEDENDTDSRRRNSESSIRGRSPGWYLQATQNRRAAILAPFLKNWNAQSYSIDPVGAAPHGAHAHAMALSTDGTTLLTGGGDGHVRKYDVYASMNGKAMLTQNVRHQFVDGVLKAGVLSAWWANEEIPQFKGEEDFEEEEHYVSAVHSLAIQQESLWGLSGTESGNINLYSLRHDPGQLRHVLRRHTTAVSAMILTNDDTELISGGWDRSVHQWDLNTGQVVRSYPGHTGQISSISLRPLQLGQKLANTDLPNILIRPSALSQSPRSKMSVDGVESINLASTPSSKAGLSASTSPVKNKSPLKQQIAAVNVTQQSREDNFNEEAELTPGMIAKEEDVDGKVNQGEFARVTPYTTPMARKDSEVAVKDDANAESTVDSEMKGDKSHEGDSLFGEDNTADDMELERDLNEALGLGISESSQNKAGGGMVDMEEGEELQEPDRPNKAGNSKTKSVEIEKDGDEELDLDGDSLFGGDSADGDADADGELDAEGEADVDVDADGEADAEGEDDDADGEDDDAPLAARLTSRPTPSMNIIELPGSVASKGSSPPANPSSTKKQTNGILRKKALPKPAFGGADVTANFDGDVSKFSNDILLTTTLGGQVTLWDKRVPFYPGESSNNVSSATHKGVRALALPDKTPPWCMSACWNSRGDKIYVGRRNETVDEWDLRMIPDIDSNTQEGLSSNQKGNARFSHSLRLPPGSGSVTAVAAMPNNRHIVCGSYDNVRLWDTQALESKVPFRIVAGHHGGVVSQIIIDPTCRFLFTSSGDRGWLSTSTETVLLHEIQAS